MAKVKILQCDEPSPYTGRIYPSDEIELAIEKYREKIADNVAYGTFGNSPTPGEMNIADISHKVTDISINDEGEVFVDYEILGTPAGESLKKVLESVRLSPALIGHVTREGVAYDLMFFTTSWLADPTE